VELTRNAIYRPIGDGLTKRGLLALLHSPVRLPPSSPSLFSNLSLVSLFPVGLRPCRYCYKYCCRDLCLSILSGWIKPSFSVSWDYCSLITPHRLPAVPIPHRYHWVFARPRYRLCLSLRYILPPERPILLLEEEFARQFNFSNSSRYDAAFRV
jgi:hypothetical protein